MIHDLPYNIAIARGRTRGLQRRASVLALCLMLAACGSGSSGTTAAGAKVDLGVLRGKSFADSRIVSAMALSPQGTGHFGFYDNGGDDHSWANVTLPVLTQTGLGDGDPLTGEARPDRRIPFEKMPAPDKMEAFLNEPRAIHATFNLNSDAPTEFHDWIRATGIAWFDATLQQRDTARAWLASDALVQVSDGLVEVSRK